MSAFWFVFFWFVFLRQQLYTHDRNLKSKLKNKLSAPKTKQGIPKSSTVSIILLVESSSIFCGWCGSITGHTPSQVNLVSILSSSTPYSSVSVRVMASSAWNGFDGLAGCRKPRFTNSRYEWKTFQKWPLLVLPRVWNIPMSSSFSRTLNVSLSPSLEYEISEIAKKQEENAVKLNDTLCPAVA